MLKTLAFTTKWRCFNEGDTFEFRPGVNLLVGDQGCGKSSLIQAIASGAKSKKYQYEYGLEKKIKYTAVASVCGGFDFEKDNHRTLSYFDHDNMQTQIAMMFSSHGQSNLTIIRSLTKVDKTMIWLDEPDMALSIRSITQTAGIFKDAAERGCQIIAAVHHPFLIWSFPEVYSLEHRMWMPSREFVDSQSNPLDKPKKCDTVKSRGC